MRSQKKIKNGTLEPGISALKSVSGGPFFGHLLIWPDAGGARRTAARTDGRWLLVGQRNVIGASRKNLEISESRGILFKLEYRFRW